MNAPTRVAAIAAANELAPVNLNDKKVHQLVEFLQSLTDPASNDLRGDTPKSLPCGLPLAE